MYVMQPRRPFFSFSEKTVGKFSIMSGEAAGGVGLPTVFFMQLFSTPNSFCNCCFCAQDSKLRQMKLHETKSSLDVMLRACYMHLLVMYSLPIHNCFLPGKDQKNNIYFFEMITNLLSCHWYGKSSWIFFPGQKTWGSVYKKYQRPELPSTIDLNKY